MKKQFLFLAALCFPMAASSDDTNIPWELTASPGTTVVVVGDTVTWEWADAFSHDVKSDDVPFDSGFKQGEGMTFQYQFNESGAFDYYCSIHGSQFGSIDVQPLPDPVYASSFEDGERVFPDEVTVPWGIAEETYSSDIYVGGTVTWEWTDGFAHDVDSSDVPFDSDSMSGQGMTFQYQFDETGNFSYFCSIHGSQHGTVNVHPVPD